MADELLRSIIQIENEILEQLEQEQARADAWLERVRDEQKKELSHLNEEQRQADRIALKEAQGRAADEATEIVRQEAERCQRLESISDNDLVEILKRHLVRILPG